MRLGMVLIVGLLVCCATALFGCGGGTKTVTETVEVESRTTYEGEGGGVDRVTAFCSSPEGEEVDAIGAEANQALVDHDDAQLVASIEAMIQIAEKSPPGARCVYAPLDSAKILLTEHPALIRRISQVQQSRELTEVDVDRVEQEG